LVGGKVAVEMEGGTLEIEVGADFSIVMKGPVEEVFTGTLSLDLRARLEALK
jgi:diaminopimelate epimerase